MANEPRKVVSTIYFSPYPLFEMGPGWLRVITITKKLRRCVFNFLKKKGVGFYACVNTRTHGLAGAIRICA